MSNQNVVPARVENIVAPTDGTAATDLTSLSIGTLFTLFVVPAMYLFLSSDHHTKKFKQT